MVWQDDNADAVPFTEAVEKSGITTSAQTMDGFDVRSHDD